MTYVLLFKLTRFVVGVIFVTSQAGTPEILHLVERERKRAIKPTPINVCEVSGHLEKYANLNLEPLRDYRKRNYFYQYDSAFCPSTCAQTIIADSLSDP